MNVVVNGLMTNYQKLGQGSKILVFLHGWGDTSKTFTKLIEQLQDDYKILAVDLPGFGATQAPENAWGLEDYAEFVAAWLKKIDISMVDTLIGHSFGGAVAIIGLGSGVLKADRLILIAASGVRDQQTLKKRLMWGTTKLLKIPLYLLPAHRAERLKTFLYHKAGSDIMLLPHMRLTFARIIKDDVRQVAGDIKTPALLVYGTKDNETPPSYGRLLAKVIPNSRLEIIDGAGHFLHQEQSEQVASLMKDSLKAKA